MQRSLFALLLCAIPACAVLGQSNSVADAHWSFAQSEGAAPLDSVHRQKATLSGEFRYVPGISGEALRLDGYTTGMTVPFREADADLRNGFTLAAWVALNTYPWNRVPIVDQQLAQQQGFFFGIDALGHLALDVSINGQWQSLTSASVLPLKRWAHVAGTYQANGDEGKLTLYLNDNPVGQLAVRGEMLPAHTNILVGRVRTPLVPFPEAAAKPQHAIWYSLDGILDEVGIYGRSLSGEEIAAQYAAAHTPTGEVLSWPRMPSGPAGPGRFGAYYATLHYQDTWDRLRRIGPESDVVVRFEALPIRLVFWQGANYIPAWVTENEKWYTDEFAETYVAEGCPAGGDCEPMSDKQSRYSHVRILESDDARAVVHWRYALSEVEHYKGAWADPLTGWFEWADEYWTVYPDGVAIRKQVVHNSAGKRANEWQETIVLHQPGSRPEDDINWDALTLENMKGETQTYTWRPRPDGVLGLPNGPTGVTGPANPNIQLVNMKSQWKPFQIVSPEGVGADIYNHELTYFAFECWNHWPVAQIISSDRPCVAADRASHSSLSHLHWNAYAADPNTETKLLMDGLTTKAPAELLPLARSWLSPAPVTVEGNGFGNGKYDPAQRAYVVARIAAGSPAPLTLKFSASEASPLVNPAVVIRGWGEGSVGIRADGKPLVAGKDFRAGHVAHLDGTDLVIWLPRQSVQPLELVLTPANR